MFPELKDRRAGQRSWMTVGKVVGYQVGGNVAARGAEITKAVERTLASVLNEMEITESFEQSNDMMWSSFRRITLAAVLRPDCQKVG